MLQIFDIKLEAVTSYLKARSWTFGRYQRLSNT